MEIGNYRLEYAAGCSALERARYEFYAGLAPEPRLRPVRERYADLWTREAIADLARARTEVSAGFETELAGLDALANAARLGYAEARAGGATEELSRCESSARIEWDGARLSACEAAQRLYHERDAARRRELAARSAEALRACDDLRLARLDSLNEAARSLDSAEAGRAAALASAVLASASPVGFQSYGALLARATRTHIARLLAAADALLERTARIYDTVLRRWAAARLPPALAPDHADQLFFVRLARLDRFFPGHEARTAFDATVLSLGIRAGGRSSPRIEESARAGAHEPCSLGNALRVGEARSFALSPPEDVRLVFAPRDGADFFRRYFFEAAWAQQLAWSSPDLAARHPEFVHAVDSSTGAGFGFLFRSLWLDETWLAEARGLGPAEAREIAASCALVEMHDARRESALAHDWLELDTAGGVRSEALARAYAARQTEATGFRHTPPLHLADVMNNGPRAAELLRGRLFAAAACERLRTRHGRRWWAARAAGDELVDLWNTSSRYSAEELAALADFGAPDNELLCDQLTVALGTA